MAWRPEIPVSQSARFLAITREKRAGLLGRYSPGNTRYKHGVLPGSCTVMTNFVRCKHDISGSDILPGSCRKKLLSTAAFLAAARSGSVREDVRSVTADKCRIFRGRTVVTQIGLIRDVPGVGVTGP